MVIRRLVVGLVVVVLLAACGGVPQEAVQPSPIVVTQVVTQIVTQEVEKQVTVVVTATPKPVTPTIAPTAAPTETPAPATGKWVVENDTSSFDDSQTVILVLDAEGEIQGAFETTLPSLILRCQEGTTDAYVFTGLQADVEGVLDGATVRYRFDKEEPQTQVAGESTDGEALFFQNPKEMIGAMLAHEQMVFEFTPFSAPPAEMTFDLRGLSEAIKPLNEACGA